MENFSILIFHNFVRINNTTNIEYNMFFFLLSLAADICNDDYNYYSENLTIMDVTQLPFNKLIGIRHSADPEYLLMLDDNQDYHNHLGTVHASAEFALAEATSGHFLFHEFGEFERIIPVVRKSEIRFRKPAKGQVFSKAHLAPTTIKEEVEQMLADRRRVSLPVEVSLFDETYTVIMKAVFEWVILPE